MLEETIFFLDEREYYQQHEKKNKTKWGPGKIWTKLFCHIFENETCQIGVECYNRLVASRKWSKQLQ